MYSFGVFKNIDIDEYVILMGVLKPARTLILKKTIFECGRKHLHAEAYRIIQIT